MKPAASLLILLACVAKAQTLDIQASVDSLPSYTYYDPSFVRLTWTPNYVVTNEETSILQSTDLVNWTVVFTEPTDECFVTPTQPMTFWRAENLTYTN
jgi:hypothetical protein